MTFFILGKILGEIVRKEYKMAKVSKQVGATFNKHGDDFWQNDLFFNLLSSTIIVLNLVFLAPFSEMLCNRSLTPVLHGPQKPGLNNVK